MDHYEQTMLAYQKKHRLFEKGNRLVIGVSGGIDSMVLLQFLAKKRHQLGVHLTAVHIDHMLRGEQSAEDRRFVEHYCKLWEVPCVSFSVPIPAILAEYGGNAQSVCRNERYRIFEQVMEKTGSTVLITAHHADDQLETILMEGMRGSLGNGAFGMRLKRPLGSGMLVRPQLAVTKEEITQYAQLNKVPYREDPSNASDAYTRNRIRKTILPAMAQENPRASLHFSELAEQINEDSAFLQQLAEGTLKELLSSDKELLISAESFRSHPSALQKRMVLLLLNYLYDDKRVLITSHLAEQVRELLQSSSGTVFLHLPQNYMMIRQYDQVFFEKHSENLQRQRADIGRLWSPPVLGSRYRVVPVGEEPEAENAVFWYFHSEKTDFMLRGREPGDRILLAGMSQAKKLARLMIDEKIPSQQRDDWPIIVAGKNEVLLVPGLRIAACLSRTKRPADNRVLVEQCIDYAK
ncbi:tRNA lysidine(34) synthetase TilS [Planococcus maitriensis]|uniref:tRNA(Ile)-lysidine synthase n=1 Tax=Planococcus maitriensis TaxID=221799 RepID=A0A365JZH5_9BACL|nr:tRNA lysidine(34) synthetase TilS [Planococcus maitriensis]RAZ65818.1 tRNA lysidine(34) synthetase TilS [Planococcus maitriensis]